MRAAWIVTAFALLTATAFAGELAADGVPMTLDGEATRAGVVSIEGGLDVRPDDLIAVGDFLLTRGTEPALKFRIDSGRLWQTFADGKERVVCAIAAALRPGEKYGEDIVVGNTTYGGTEPQRDTFAGLGDADIAALRGVIVVNWSETVAAEVAKVDAARAAFVVRVCEEDAVPPLPAACRSLILAGYPHDSTSLPVGIEPLARLTELRLLKLGWHYDEATDLTPLAGMKELRRLDLDFRDVEHAEVLGKLTSLRVLDASGSESLTDGSFLKPLKHLVTLNVMGTPIADLSALSDHPELREIWADGSKVRTLPGGELPALRLIRLLSTQVPPADAEAFAKAHPSCDVVSGWRGPLVMAVEKTDRVRVRSGGTCHRDPEDEAVLFEVRAREDIAELMEILRFDDTAPPDACMCCGHPTIEFYSGDKLAFSLGYHHGRTLRWPGGAWPGDARLLPESADRLCEWLARRGADGPKKEREEAAKRAAEIAARDKEQDELLGMERIRAIHGAADVETAGKLFAGYFPDRAARLPILLRLASRETRSGNVELRDRVVAQAEWVLIGAEEPAAVAEFFATQVVAGGPAAKAVADMVDSMDEERFDGKALEALHLSAARFLLAEGDTRGAAYLLDDAETPAADAMLVTLLPAAGPDGLPAGTVTALHGSIACDLAKRCDDALLPRLRSIVQRAPVRRGENPLERFDRIVGDREPSKEAPK